MPSGESGGCFSCRAKIDERHPLREAPSGKIDEFWRADIEGNPFAPVTLGKRPRVCLKCMEDWSVISRPTKRQREKGLPAKKLQSWRKRHEEKMEKPRARYLCDQGDPQESVCPRLSRPLHLEEFSDLADPDSKAFIRAFSKITSLSQGDCEIYIKKRRQGDTLF
eukprot:Plantae.Rhodophyta-Hildenbrandia_rubra.ctg9058.p1 GENE.Plantae.Rhodophyta-Hildenbrandia_rubra.ctg9058~~Plantae.Rhodophyta-Hildenbrandia_rubra.ctg9058.p1  ORF type:complete len:165 (+),score=15.96 Plantae.Rhodophyta-Hildenbrandia_rubra.ctg9058:1314-1808(+)